MPKVPKTLLIGLPLVGGYLMYRWFLRNRGEASWFFSSSKSQVVDDASHRLCQEPVVEKKPEKKPEKKSFETLS